METLATIISEGITGTILGILNLGIIVFGIWGIFKIINYISSSKPSKNKDIYTNY